jgi:DNA-binding IclR family transcriptional regulator
VTTLDELAARVEESARRGYAVADGELEPGLAAVAAPVRRFDGQIVAAVNVSGPSFRFSPRLDEAGAEVARAAARLEAELSTPDIGVASVAT